MSISLTCDDFVAAFDRSAGRAVAVRVVTESDDLIAVFCGAVGSTLEGRSSSYARTE